MGCLAPHLFRHVLGRGGAVETPQNRRFAIAGSSFIDLRSYPHLNLPGPLRAQPLPINPGGHRLQTVRELEVSPASCLRQAAKAKVCYEAYSRQNSRLRSTPRAGLASLARFLPRRTPKTPRSSEIIVPMTTRFVGVIGRLLPARNTRILNPHRASWRVDSQNLTIPTDPKTANSHTT